jgi:hypothetical protein
VKVAEQVLGYLWGTSSFALELGGGQLDIVGFSDSSHGTGKEGRSVNGTLVKLSRDSGAILAKTVKSKYVRLSSFECEMEALNNTVKLVSWVKALLRALVAYDGVPTIFCNNEALVNYVRGNSEVKSVRHMEQKMYYCREEHVKKAYQVKFMEGRRIPSNVLTKVVPREEFHRFVRDVLGNDIDIILRDSEGDRSLDEAQLLPGGAQLGGVLAGDLESTVV